MLSARIATCITPPLRRLALTLAAIGFAGSGCGSSIARVDPELFPPPPRNAITFWGHACCYIDLDGFGIVTDPVFEKNLFFRTRKVPAPPPSDYAAARVILVSHAHDDHLSPATLRTFPDSAVVLCPPPVADYLGDIDRPVHVLGLGDTYPIPGGQIVAVAANHMAGRLGFHPKADGRALGFVIETPTVTIYYTGDTNFFSGFVDVAQEFHPDITIMNVNGHLHDTEAARAAAQTGADIIVPVHHGAYGFLFVHERRGPRSSKELEARLGPKLVPIALGQSLRLSSTSNAERRGTPP